MARPGYLVEITPQDRLLPFSGGGSIVKQNFSSGDFNPDIVPAAEYNNAIAVLPSFRRDMFARNTTGGQITVSNGSIMLANADGSLDFLKAFSWNGASLTVKYGDLDDTLASFTVMFNGRVEQLLFDFKNIEIRMQDLLQLFDKQMGPTRYAGNSTSTEGDLSIKDKGKPAAYGHLYGIPAIQTSASLLIYQFHILSLNSVPNVFDKGVLLTQGANYPDLATMEAVAPAAGGYRVWPSGGGTFIRLGSTPVGTIAAHVVEDASTANHTVAQIFNRISLGFFFVSVAAGDITTMDAKQPAEIGIYFTGDDNGLQVLDKIAITGGAWYGFDRLGTLRLQRFELPTLAASVATLRVMNGRNDADENDIDIRDFRMMPTRDEDKGVSTYKVTANYLHNYTVQSDNDLAGAVNQSDRAFWRNEWRKAVKTDTNAANYAPGSKEKEVDTYFSDTTDVTAAAEAQRVLDLFKISRDFAEIDIELSATNIALLDLGNVITVYFDRFDYAYGKPMLITGMEYNSANNVLILAVWG